MMVQVDQTMPLLWSSARLAVTANYNAGIQSKYRFLMIDSYWGAEEEYLGLILPGKTHQQFLPTVESCRAVKPGGQKMLVYFEYFYNLGFFQKNYFFLHIYILFSQEVLAHFV